MINKAIIGYLELLQENSLQPCRWHHIHSIDAPFNVVRLNITLLNDLSISKRPETLTGFYDQIFQREKVNEINDKIQTNLNNENAQYFNYYIGSFDTKYKKYDYNCTVVVHNKMLHCFTTPSFWSIPVFESTTNRLIFQKKSLVTTLSLITEREKEIIILLSKGYTRSEIASIINISIYTYDNHRRSINKKLKKNQFVSLLMHFKDKK